ncbi:G patch domain-containing protein [Verticillium alfalfae VaMs.102]|uniref:G patch domain-containing protein n=1 Tax=Verticillium alfalfae (strain VaMs.102 / ATCC MYA-4576 / FGSC 10136) TaxID=526221 RepID=C9STJ1_VERA1|nr:G patch domain-containing protein [Verticillium alfalfae VaMs.102]EEY22106.1 G patch domain-containing protein [Verticillium alfalfae VaMs.102]
MGWREGQGIGPKVRRPARLHDTEAVSTHVPESHLFAPDDVAVVSVIRKIDHHGLGYSAMCAHDTHEPAGFTRRTSEEDVLNTDGFGMKETSRSLMGGRSKDTKGHGGGMGFGILNDNGSDDDDGYQMAPRISRIRTLTGSKKRKKKKLPSGTVLANPALGSKPAFKSQPIILKQRDGRLCRDGSSPLPGFVLGDITVSSESSGSSGTVSDPPNVPQGWRSSKHQSSEAGEAPAGMLNVLSSAGNSTVHDPRSRALALGEVPLPGKSIFDFLSTAARERLVAASGRTNLPPAGGETVLAQSSKDCHEDSNTRQRLPVLDKETAVIAIERGKGARGPYADDEEKQSRYRAYLAHSAGLISDHPAKPNSLGWREFAQEQQEFYGCAQLFRPMTGIMATRFTTSTLNHVSSDPKNTVESSRRSPVPNESQPLDGAEQAARLGLYGQLTRSGQDFFPTRLLCKRFNVPFRDPSLVGLEPFQARSTVTLSSLNIGHFLDDRKEEPLSNEDIGSLLSTRPSEPIGSYGSLLQEPRTAAGLNSDGTTQKKPDEDVFKAIFGDDSDCD